MTLTAISLRRRSTRFGSLDAALLNAGIVGKILPTVEYDLDLFDKVLAVNVRGVFLGLKHMMPAMETSGGSIVITSSTAGIRALPGLAAYTASKHAVIGLMRTAGTGRRCAQYSREHGQPISHRHANDG